MATSWTITFLNDFGSNVRLEIRSGPNDPHAAGGCDSNPVQWDNVINDGDTQPFKTGDSNVSWRRSSGPGDVDDALPTECNIVEQGNGDVAIKLSDQI